MAGGVALLLVVMFPMALRADDPIKAKLEMAKAAYEADFKKLRQALFEHFDQQEQAARKAADEERTEQIIAQRLAFKAFGDLPDAAPDHLKRAFSAARASLEGAYETAVKEYASAKKNDQALSLKWQLDELKSPVTLTFSSRVGAAKEKFLRDGGGNVQTEAAVALALRWLALQQNLVGGFWEYDGVAKPNRVAATGICLLPFLAAGETHRSATMYKKTVAHGLDYLKDQVKPTGELHPNMYAHAIATMALCEAVGMTKDEVLKPIARQAVDYIVKAQADYGSWGYQAGTEGDTSIVGWQIQALKSARLAGIPVPEKSFQQAAIFLESVSTDDGSTYGYRARGSTYTLSAVGLLCRQYMGWNPRNPSLAKGVDFLCTKNPPKEKDFDMYYYYYATQVIHFFDGPAWHRDWNPKMQRILLDKQIKEKNNGKPADAGSWPKDNGPHIGEQCGKLGSTAMACLTLEVYYRHMPLFKRGDDGLKSIDQ